jgi:hypothetical protein
MHQQKREGTGDDDECLFCRVTYSIFSNFPPMPSAMALNVETDEFFPQDLLLSYSNGHQMAEALGYAWACNCRERDSNRFDEQFTLTDVGGSALADTYYTVRLPSGELRYGITDSKGRTERHLTKGAQSVRIYLGHRG